MSNTASAQEDRKISIPVPTSLTSTTPGLPHMTSHLLVTHLREINAVPELQSLLSDSLARTGWTDRVRALALELLRNGTCDTFPELLDEVMRRAKIPRDTAGSKNRDDSGSGTQGSATGGKSIPGSQSQAANGTSTPTSTQQGGANGNGAIAVRDGWFGPDGLPDVRIPEKTVEVGVEFLKEKIADVVVPVADDD